MGERIVIVILALVAAVSSVILRSKVTIIISDPQRLSERYFNSKARKLLADK